MKTFIVDRYKKIKEFNAKYERWFMPATLAGGFLIDYVTFTNVQISTTFAISIFYWVLAGIFIIFNNVYDASFFAKDVADKRRISQALRYVRLFSPLAIQFSFGALLGSSLIFYWFSGAFSVSWPLMIMIVVLMVFNETFRDYFEKPAVQISLYFFATLSLFSLGLPFLFKSLSAWLFVVASVVSLVLFVVDIHVLSLWVEHIRRQKRQLFISIFAIAGLMNLLYFTNIIPPIPLALREAGFYHSLKTSGTAYIMQAEHEDFLEKVHTALFGQTMHLGSGSRVYLYNAIFAPDKLNTTIVHNWQYYDEAKKEWVSKNKLTFAINGGRKDGYKGYSYNSNLAVGSWRVSVENLRGQVLGIVRLTVERANEPVELQEVTR